jgi:RimJ/RimL family protein N-acetyltransferase
VPAVRLYERFGFVHEGVHRRAVFKDGQYEDNLSMAVLL